MNPALKLIEEARDGLLGHETFLGQRRWFRSLGTPEHPRQGSGTAGMTRPRFWNQREYRLFSF